MSFGETKENKTLDNYNLHNPVRNLDSRLFPKCSNFGIANAHLQAKKGWFYCYIKKGMQKIEQCAGCEFAGEKKQDLLKTKEKKETLNEYIDRMRKENGNKM